MLHTKLIRSLTDLKTNFNRKFQYSLYSCFHEYNFFMRSLYTFLNNHWREYVFNENKLKYTIKELIDAYEKISIKTQVGGISNKIISSQLYKKKRNLHPNHQ